MDDAIHVWIGDKREGATNDAYVRARKLRELGKDSSRDGYHESNLITSFWSLHTTGRRHVLLPDGRHVPLLSVKGSPGWTDTGPSLSHRFQTEMYRRLRDALVAALPNQKTIELVFQEAYTFWQQATGFKVVLVKMPPSYFLSGISRLGGRKQPDGTWSDHYIQPLWVLVVPSPWWQGTYDQLRTLLTSFLGASKKSQIRRIAAESQSKVWLEVALPNLDIVSVDPDALQF